MCEALHRADWFPLSAGMNPYNRQNSKSNYTWDKLELWRIEMILSVNCSSNSVLSLIFTSSQTVFIFVVPIGYFFGGAPYMKRQPNKLSFINRGQPH